MSHKLVRKALRLRKTVYAQTHVRKKVKSNKVICFWVVSTLNHPEVAIKQEKLLLHITSNFKPYKGCVVTTNAAAGA
jgi:hypothetical protein